MVRFKRYKYRIYPTECQKVQINKTFGCVRKIHNLMLADYIEYYQLNGTMAKLTPAQYKEAYPYLVEVDSHALNYAKLHLDTAFKNFFKRKEVGYPKFKKRSNYYTYTTYIRSERGWKYNDCIKLPKLGLVKVDFSRLPPENSIIKAATIIKEIDSTYHISLLVQYESDVPVIEHIENSITLMYENGKLLSSDRSIDIELPDFNSSVNKQIIIQQRKLSNKQKDSKNYEKQRVRLAKKHLKVANRRKDYLQKLSTEICNKYDEIIFINSKVNKDNKTNVQDEDKYVGIYYFSTLLQQKQEERGHVYTYIDNN